jgi:DNA-binding transcriptional LysR family regulator
MDIESLRTFVEVADAGGVTAAALRLGVSKSIVSRRLARMEAELGVQLLARTTRGAALTEAGITFRDHAAKICGEYDIAMETILPAGDLRGSFRIAAPLTFGPTHFASVIADMARLNPLLQVRSSYSDRFVDLITEGFDCAIRIGHLTDSNLVARKVGYTPAIYVATPEYIARRGAPETPDEFGDHDVVMHGAESWFALDGDRLINLKPHGRFKADNAVALVAAALAGVGVAGIPKELIIEHLDSGALVPVMKRFPPPTLGIYVVRPPGQHPERKVRVLTEMMIACCQNLCKGIMLRDAHRAGAPDLEMLNLRS